MKKNLLLYICLIFIMFVFLPTIALASEGEFEEVAENTKYYKVVTRYNSSVVSKFAADEYDNPFVQSETFEITKEEYDAVGDSETTIMGSVTVENTYRMVKSSILSDGNYYRYRNYTVWKLMPSVQSYDIIGIGFLASVKLHGNPTFIQNYCTTTCSSSTASYMQAFPTGVGATFKVASGNLISLNTEFYFDVEKNTTATVIKQKAYSDYSHAITPVLLTSAMNYQVNSTLGIVLNSSVSSYYDALSVADATWTGSW